MKKIIKNIVVCTVLAGMLMAQPVVAMNNKKEIIEEKKEKLENLLGSNATKILSLNERVLERLKKIDLEEEQLGERYERIEQQYESIEQRFEKIKQQSEKIKQQSEEIERQSVDIADKINCQSERIAIVKDCSDVIDDEIKRLSRGVNTITSIFSTIKVLSFIVAVGFVVPPTTVKRALFLAGISGLTYWYWFSESKNLESKPKKFLEEAEKEVSAIEEELEKNNEERFEASAYGHGFVGVL